MTIWKLLFHFVDGVFDAVMLILVGGILVRYPSWKVIAAAAVIVLLLGVARAVRALKSVGSDNSQCEPITTVQWRRGG